MYNHNKAQQSKNRVHISWDILYPQPGPILCWSLPGRCIQSMARSSFVHHIGRAGKAIHFKRHHWPSVGRIRYNHPSRHCQRWLQSTGRPQKPTSKVPISHESIALQFQILSNIRALQRLISQCVWLAEAHMKPRGLGGVGWGVGGWGGGVGGGGGRGALGLPVIRVGSLLRN